LRRGAGLIAKQEDVKENDVMMYMKGTRALVTERHLSASTCSSARCGQGARVALRSVAYPGTG
jgi:hypothetical protein